MRFLDHMNYLGKYRICPDVGGAKVEVPGFVNSATNYLVPRILSGRSRFSSDHGLVDVTAALGNITIDWNAFTWAHTDDISGNYGFDRDLDLVIITHYPCCLWLYLN